MDDGKFGYAAIFAGMTILMGVMIAISPIIMRYIADKVVKKQGVKELADEAGRTMAVGA